MTQIMRRTKRRIELLTTNRCYVLLFFMLTLYIIVLCSMFKTPTINAIKSVALPHVVVHIDLKGSPPKLKYLQTLLPVLKELGVNGLLMEYEDMFPYERRLFNLSAENRYEKAELKEFLTLATHMGFEIIPLVQTFGHMEHVLKLEEFQRLREMVLYPDSICPSNTQSLSLLEEMLKQIIRFHETISPLKYIHIGSDEVFLINRCRLCRKRHLSDTELYLAHVETVLAIIERLSGHTTVLIWDDMLRKVAPIEWELITYTSNVAVVPVYWDYTPSVNLSHTSLLQYHKKFGDIWIATAFKGADGLLATLPDMKDRFKNHLSWMNSIIDYKFGGERKVYDFKGIILTGWSRYSHMDPACELLPVAFPSLILNLLLIKRFKEGFMKHEKSTDWRKFYRTFLKNDLKHYLKCDHPIEEDFKTSRCEYDGVQIYNQLRESMLINEQVKAKFNDDKLWFSSSEYYSKLNNLNMLRMTQNAEWSQDYLSKIRDLEYRMINTLNRYYDDNFIREYVFFKTYNAKNKVETLMRSIIEFLRIRSWKRGPIKNTKFYNRVWYYGRTTKSD